MSNKIKNIITTVLFSAFIAVFSVMCVLQAIHPVLYSDVEKRPMAQFPTDFTWQELLKNESTEDKKSPIGQFEDFTVDQFPLREFFRYVKAHWALDVLQLKENNKYVEEDGYISKLEGDFSDKMVDGTLKKLATVYNKYLKDNGGNKFVSIIPDKSYYLGRDYGYPTADYHALADKVQAALPGMTYVDLYDSLKLQDFYRADTHWQQQNLQGVVNTLGAALGVELPALNTYKHNVLEGFKGVQNDQSGLYPALEQLIYLTSDVLDDCRVYDYETMKTTGIYALGEFESKEPYGVYLAGTRALLRIDNPHATTDKELIIFRDSYGSSVAPLLVEGYKSVYLVDLRYVSADFLPFYIDFEGKDVLFLYSAMILNNNVFK